MQYQPNQLLNALKNCCSYIISFFCNRNCNFTQIIVDFTQKNAPFNDVCACVLYIEYMPLKCAVSISYTRNRTTNSNKSKEKRLQGSRHCFSHHSHNCECSHIISFEIQLDLIHNIRIICTGA